MSIKQVFVTFAIWRPTSSLVYGSVITHRLLSQSQ